MDNVTTCKRVELPNTPSNITAASVPAASLKMVITSSVFEYQKTVPTGTVGRRNCLELCYRARGPAETLTNQTGRTGSNRCRGIDFPMRVFINSLLKRNT